MRHFKIHASKDNTTKIEIFGQIGDSFFEDGNTLESVRKEIESREDDLEVDIASLGGSAFEGLAIHDLFATHKGKVIMNIVGATASAGMVIAESADEINISENTLTLVHNSHGIAIGTAKDLMKTVDDMEKIDARMVSIFTKRAEAKGKTEGDIKTLMEEDKFIDAKTTIEFGFADNQIETSKIAASIDINKVMASKELTATQKTQIQDQIKTFKMETPTKETPEVKESTIISELKSGLETLKASILAIGKDKEGKEVKILDNPEVQAQLVKMNDTLSTLADANTTLEADAVIAKTELDSVKVEKETLLTDKIEWGVKKEIMQDKIDTAAGTQVKSKEGEDNEPDEDKTSDVGAFGRLYIAKMKQRQRL